MRACVCVCVCVCVCGVMLVADRSRMTSVCVFLGCCQFIPKIALCAHFFFHFPHALPFTCCVLVPPPPVFSWLAGGYLDSGPSFTNRPLLLLEKGERVCFCMGREGWGEKRRGRGEEKEEAGRERGGHTLHLTHTTYHTQRTSLTHTHTQAHFPYLGVVFPLFSLLAVVRARSHGHVSIKLNVALKDFERVGFRNKSAANASSS